MIKWIIKRFKKEKWTLKYTVTRDIDLTEHDRKVGEETITFFLEESENGDRKFSHHSYGYCKIKKAHERFENEMILWQKTGILPNGAKNVIVEKLKGTIA